MSVPRHAIVAEALAWVGTPYQHLASCRGVGADCLGLVRGVWRGLIGPEPWRTPRYAPDWAEREAAGDLADAAVRWLAPNATVRPGAVALFRMGEGFPIKHAAILTDRDTLVHAYWGRAVVESRFSPWWRRRLALTADFPGVEPWPN